MSSETARSRSALLAPFATPIEPVRVSILYRLGIVLLAGAMVLLPVLYVGLVALLAYGVYWHAVGNAGILEQSGSAKGRVLIYVTPIVAGVVAVIFMIKPLFAPRRRRHTSSSVTRKEEPFLFEFVERLCACVGAPAPRRIDLDTEVNASASLRQGFRSLFSSDLVLTIGLPLVAGMPLRNLTGYSRPRVRPLRSRGGHATRLRDPPGQQLVCPGGP